MADSDGKKKPNERFSFRNLSFRKEKKKKPRPRSTSEVSQSASRSSVNRSYSVRSSSASTSKSSTDATRRAALANNRKTSLKTDLNANDAWNKPLIGQATHPFTAILRCDLTFNVGDKIVILTRTSTQYDWWEGRVHGRTGIFPANHIKVLD